jgi:solute carrier family 25 carnitine/acylcarnitine transporter 20/29
MGLPESDTTTLLPIHGVFMCGAFSGIAAGTVLCPWELLKCRVQDSQYLKGQGLPAPYNGIVDCAIKTIRNEGAFSIFNGWTATLLREIPGNAAWFGCYELSLRMFFIPENGTRDDCAWYAFPMSGGLGGIGLWSIAYPADTVKTRIQTDPYYVKLGLRKGFAHLYKQGGIQALYRGFGVTLLRAFPANATIFAIYELSSKLLKGDSA